MLLPCLGNHQQHSLLQRASAHQKKFQRVVEVSRVRAFRLHDRIQLLQILSHQFALQRALPRAHGVHIAAKRVDLAVMTHEPERLRAVPTRESVGRESRVHHGEVRGEIWIGQISKVL